MEILKEYLIKDCYFQHCNNDILNETLDEAPNAYKPMNEILEAIGEAVEVVDIIKPIYNFKAH